MPHPVSPLVCCKSAWLALVDRSLFFSSDSKSLQLSALSLLKQWNLLEFPGMLLQDYPIIPRLVRLLDPIYDHHHEVALGSFYLLSNTINSKLCYAMVVAGAVPALCRVLSSTTSEEVFDCAAQTIIQCLKHHHHV